MSYALRTELRSTALTLGAVLASFGAAVAIQRTAHQGPALAVLAVVLALTFRRVAARHRLGPAQLLAVPVLGACAALVGRLMVVHPDVGDPLFVLAMSGAIWARRFGPRATRVGTLVALPFIAMLITPVPPTSGPGHLLWAAVVSVVAVATVLVVQRFEPAPPAAGPAPARDSAPAKRRLAASTRMALQMAVALSAAFLLGRLLFHQHWPWLVLSAYLVNTGNRGRGDVVVKGVQRVSGAALGTVAATLVAGAFAPHNPVPVALIFVVLAVAGWLRRYSYAYWAAGVTAALSLLYGYFGATDPGILARRLLALGIGALLGVAAAWLVFPVRTRDVLRRRVADVLAALTDYLVATRRDVPALGEHQQRLAYRLTELDRLSPTLRAHRQLTRLWRTGTHHADATHALLACGPATDALTRQLTGPDQPHDKPADQPDRRHTLAALDGVREDVVALRRALAGRGPLPQPREPTDHPAVTTLHTAVQQTARIL